jgi:hypothetical protein
VPEARISAVLMDDINNRKAPLCHYLHSSDIVLMCRLTWESLKKNFNMFLEICAILAFFGFFLHRLCLPFFFTHYKASTYTSFQWYFFYCRHSFINLSIKKGITKKWQTGVVLSCPIWMTYELYDVLRS